MADSRSPLTATDIGRLDWNKSPDGLLPAVVQDSQTRQVLMVAWMDRAALTETLASGQATFHSRSRGGRWRKGETSGNTLAVNRVLADCDADTLLVEARPAGPACHEGVTSCFGRDTAPGVGFLSELGRIVNRRAGVDPDLSYTARLLDAGTRRIAQKVGEEGVETALAAVAGTDQELLDEAADFLFHLTVLLHARGLSIEAVTEVLRQRQSVSAD